MSFLTKEVYRIDPESKEILQLIISKNTALLGIDGLNYYKDNLIAIQNRVAQQRVVELSLSRKLTEITKVKTLEANHKDFVEPTLGVIIEDQLYYNANSQWEFVNEKGELAIDKLKSPVILRLNL